MQSTETGEQRSGDISSFDGNASSGPVTPPRPKDGGPKIGSTPIANHRAVSSELNAIPEKLESRMAGFHAEITRRVVGPIDVKHFNKFLPAVQSTGTEHNGVEAYQKLQPEMETAKNEGDMYGALVNYLNDLRPSENISFCDKHHKILRVFDGVDIKPDIMVFHGNDEATIEAMFEVKYHEEDDPFHDRSDFQRDPVHDRSNFQRDSIRSKSTLGQITSYATCHQALEFRTHAFSALIFRNYMRLLRFDRSGVVVTGEILFDEPSLFDFFCRFPSATPAERGRDSTVTAANLSCQTEEIRRLLNCKEKAPLLTISIDRKEYIILKEQGPGSTSPIGRSTRCFKAYCLEKKRVILLKDSWRVVSPNLQPEHEIYEKLRKAKVQNIPELWYGKTDHAIKLTSRTHRHYRIVLEYLPFRLEEFEITREMIAIVRDASIAHRDAAIEAKVAHRDISNGNIMFKRNLDGNVQGFLIDWDLSLDLAKILRKYSLSVCYCNAQGTWKFLAIRLLESTDEEPVIQNRIDDVESFYHLILWMAL
ncbi:hypothetical protein C0993_003264 [Termitomyces sp. T159_Od127]|nr:hypothetical protein C0993_003264 [Termitomyces sp. T159_Od127]